MESGATVARTFAVETDAPWRAAPPRRGSTKGTGARRRYHARSDYHSQCARLLLAEKGVKYVRRADISPTNRGAAAAATWIVRGEQRRRRRRGRTNETDSPADGSRRGRGRDVDRPWRAAARPLPRRGRTNETRARRRYTPKEINEDRLEQYEAWYLRLNPAASLPTLVCGGTVIADPRQIVEWIQELPAGRQPMRPPPESYMRKRYDELLDAHYEFDVPLFTLAYPRPRRNPGRRLAEISAVAASADYPRRRGRVAATPPPRTIRVVAAATFITEEGLNGTNASTGTAWRSPDGPRRGRCSPSPRRSTRV